MDAPSHQRYLTYTPNEMKIHWNHIHSNGNQTSDTVLNTLLFVNDEVQKALHTLYKTTTGFKAQAAVRSRTAIVKFHWKRKRQNFKN